MSAATLNWAVNPTLPIVLPLLAAFLLGPRRGSRPPWAASWDH